MHITGQCHCGFVTYEAEVDPERVSICHCQDCQMLTGSAYRVTATASAQSFRLTSGIPKVYIKSGDSGRRSAQYFCPDCGSPVYRTAADEATQEVGIRLGTINQRRKLSPKRQIWCRSALPWAKNLRDLPAIDGDD